MHRNVNEDRTQSAPIKNDEAFKIFVASLKNGYPLSTSIRMCRGHGFITDSYVGARQNSNKLLRRLTRAGNRANGHWGCRETGRSQHRQKSNKIYKIMSTNQSGSEVDFRTQSKKQ